MSALLQLISKAKSKYTSTDDAIRPKEGKNRYRILAPTKEQASWVGPDGEFWQDVGTHWIKSDVNGKPLAVVGDAATCFGEFNPLEAVIEKAIASAVGEEETKLAESWRSNRRVLLNVLDNSDAKHPSTTPQVLELSRTTWGSILEQASNFAAQGYNIFDQNTGIDIIITKTGRGINTKYDVSVMPLMPGQTPTPVSDEIMEQCVNLPEWVRSKYFKGEEQKAIEIIAQTAGIAVPGAGPALTRTKTPALTSSAAVAEGAKVNPMAASVAAAPAAVAATAEVIEPAAETAPFDTSVEDADAALAELDAFLTGDIDL